MNEKERQLYAAFAYLNAAIYGKESGEALWPYKKENFEISNQFDALFKCREVINLLLYNNKWD